ncbi:MAG: response regulator [Candidatus Eisenbacteria bacterium]|nr:response regulator [Candidatus Eisenbacteria bacterium]
MKHVLLVEDDPHNAMLIRKLLERRGGFRVTVSESADEVLSLARQGAIDLVVMDVSLGNTHLEGRPINGLDLSRLIKTHPHSVHVPVVLATAHAMRGDAETLLAESGADGYFAKPIIDHEAFVQYIRTLLSEAA